MAEQSNGGQKLKYAKQSKKMPYWLWFIIAKSLGIKLHPKDKPMLAIILHTITLFSGGCMLLTRIWFSGYDISSKMTDTDVLSGVVAIFITSLFVSLGAYSQRLAHRLFEHPKFLEMMRLHSKTIMKLNAVALAILVLAGFVIVLNLETMNNAYFHVDIHNGTDLGSVNPCQTVQVPLVICQVFYFTQVIYSVFFLLWNAMVGAVLISVARTHTINIRRFILELEFDAFLHDQKLRETIYPKDSAESQSPLRLYSWETDSKEEMKKQSIRQRITSMSIQETNDNESNLEEHLEEDPAEVFSPRQVHLELNADENVEQIAPAPPEGSSSSSSRIGSRRFLSRFRRLSETEEEAKSDENTLEPKILSDDELLHKYWKHVASAKLTSKAMQRWMCCVTVTTLFWSAVRIVYWLSHTPTLYGVFSLILPLLILPLLASAYAEVNYEGIMVLQSIMPTKERSGLFRYLYGMPIQLNVYGHAITYGTMGTVLAAILAAFASRILIQEMNRIIV